MSGDHGSLSLLVNASFAQHAHANHANQDEKVDVSLVPQAVEFKPKTTRKRKNVTTETLKKKQKQHQTQAPAQPSSSPVSSVPPCSSPSSSPSPRPLSRSPSPSSSSATSLNPIDRQKFQQFITDLLKK